MLVPGLSRLHGEIRCQKPQNKNKKKEEDRRRRREEEEEEEKEKGRGRRGQGRVGEMREEEVATVTNQNNASVKRITRTKYNYLVSYIFTLVSPYRKTELRIKISGPTGQILIY